MLNSLKNYVNTQLSTINPYKIEEANAANFNKYQVHISDNAGSFLYRVANHFEMIFTYINAKNERKAYSLFRLESMSDAESLFAHYSSRLRVLERVDRALLTRKKDVEAACEVLRQNTGYTACHTVVHLNWIHMLRHPEMVAMVNSPDDINRITPFVLSVIHANLAIVREFLTMSSVDLTIVDSNGDSVFHHAAGKPSELMTLLIGRDQTMVNHVNDEGKVPLHLTCQAADDLGTLLLLQAGADPAGGDAPYPAKPIHLAMRSCSLKCIEMLCTRDHGLINSVDSEGNSVLHYAREKDITYTLCHYPQINKNLVNTKGETPLHSVIIEMYKTTDKKKKDDYLDVIMTLLVLEADASIPNIEGETPLHSAVRTRNVDVVRALIVFEADVNCLNKRGQTPRHILSSEDEGQPAFGILPYFRASTRDRDVLIYTLHMVGANRCASGTAGCGDGCHYRGKNNGTVPEACKIPELESQSPEPSPKSTNPLTSNSAVSLLKRFDSRLGSGSVNFRNSSSSAGSGGSSTEQSVGGGEPSVYLAESASSYSLLASAAAPSIDTPDNGESDEALLDLAEGDTLLCLDGGGIRGLILAQLMRAIERRLIQQQQQQQLQLVDYFDWVSGTSTGAICALALGVGKTAAFGRCLYLKLKDRMFQGSRPYAADFLEQTLQEMFGENTVMTDIPLSRCGIMVHALLADRFPPLLHTFRNYDPPMPDPRPLKTSPDVAVCRPDEQLVWKAARASGAAPTFFKSCDQYLDGGLVANNPTLDALTELTAYYKKNYNRLPKLRCVVSLGTGRIPVIPISNRDVFMPSNPAQLLQTFRGMNSLAQIMVEQATSADYQTVRRAQAWCDCLGARYYRLSPPISADIPLDCKSTSILIQMLWETEVYLSRNADKLNQLVRVLTAPHRAAAKSKAESPATPSKVSDWS